MRVEIPRPERVFRALVVVAAAVTIAVAFQQRHRVAVKLTDPAGGHVSDFDRWMIMTPQFIHQHADYVSDEMPTPPITLMIFAPFAALSRPNAIFLWVLLKLPLACAVFLTAGRIARTAGTPLDARARLLILVAWSLSVVSDLQEGQMNFFALLPLVAGLAVAQRESTAADAGAGALIGFGMAVKLTPVVFVAYFLWRRRWTIAATALASLAVWWVFVPALAFGWDQNLRWFGQWARIMLLPYVVSGKVVYSNTQSAGSFVLRLLSHSPAFVTHPSGPTSVEPHYMNVMSLGETAVRRIVRGLMLAAGIGGLWWARRALPSLRSPRYLIEIGAVAAFMLWFSERTWVHHYVSFILMLAAAGAIASRADVPEGVRRTIVRSVVVYVVLAAFATEAGHVFGRDGVDWAKAAGVYLFGSLFVALAVVWAAGRLAPDYRYTAMASGSIEAASRGPTHSTTT